MELQTSAIEPIRPYSVITKVYQPYCLKDIPIKYTGSNTTEWRLTDRISICTFGDFPFPRRVTMKPLMMGCSENNRKPNVQSSAGIVWIVPQNLQPLRILYSMLQTQQASQLLVDRTNTARSGTHLFAIYGITAIYWNRGGLYGVCNYSKKNKQTIQQLLKVL